MFEHGNFVQGKVVVVEGPFVVGGFDDASALDSVVFPEQSIDGLVDVFRRDVGQKSQPSRVDTEDGDILAADVSGCT